LFDLGRALLEQGLLPNVRIIILPFV